MPNQWPLLRTNTVGHHEYEIGHAASIGLAVVLIGLPLIGLALSWALGEPQALPERALTAYAVAQMIAFSPMVSWMGLVLGVPAVHFAIRWGYGGWLVTFAIGAVAGAIVLLGASLMMLDEASLRIAGIGALFGGVFASVYWFVMRLAAPALFRNPESPVQTPIQ